MISKTILVLFCKHAIFTSPLLFVAAFKHETTPPSPVLSRYSKDDKSKTITNRVGDLLKKEGSFGLLDLKTYYDFGKKVEATKRKLLQFLIQAKNEGKKIVGYGAPAKGNTLLNYCGIRTDFLDYTVDRNLHKQGHYLPGTHIFIDKPERICETKPDYVFILPWNIKDEITQQMSFIREWGGKFVIPIPEVVIL